MNSRYHIKHHTSISFLPEVRHFLGNGAVRALLYNDDTGTALSSVDGLLVIFNLVLISGRIDFDLVR